MLVRKRKFRIIAATDLQARSEAAVERASQLADATGAELTLLHVVEPTQSQRALEETLQHATRLLRSRAQPPLWRGARRPATALRVGNPRRLIAEAVMAGPRAELLVLGPHRRRPVRDALEGTIAGRVIGSRASAVLMAQRPPEGGYRRVLFALDRSPVSAEAVRLAEWLALKDGTAATVVHAVGPDYEGLPGPVRIRQFEPERRMRAFLAESSADPGRYDVRIVERMPVPAILGTVEEIQPDLVVLGTRAGGSLHRALLGSVANRVLQGVSCDVLVVPPGVARAVYRRPARMLVADVGRMVRHDLPAAANEEWLAEVARAMAHAPR